jgi:hypothetical protein
MMRLPFLHVFYLSLLFSLSFCLYFLLDSFVLFPFLYVTAVCAAVVLSFHCTVCALWFLSFLFYVALYIS